MAASAKGPSTQKSKKVPAAGTVVRQGRAAKDKENAPVGSQRPANEEGATLLKVVPAKRGRPPKATSTPFHRTSQDQIQQVVAPIQNAANNPVQSTNETELENIVLRKKIADMEAQMKSNDAGADTISAILKPNGEAGDKRNGFVLRDAMELSGSPEDNQIYLAILRSARRNIIRANVDIAVDFRRQDHEKLGQVFKMTRKENPYLDRKRFPRDWATAEIVKQYLRNQRKQAKTKKARQNLSAGDEDEEDEAAGRTGGGNEGDEDDGEDENGNNDGDEEGEDEEGRRKRRRCDDPE